MICSYPPCNHEVPARRPDEKPGPPRLYCSKQCQWKQASQRRRARMRESHIIDSLTIPLAADGTMTGRTRAVVS